MSKVCDQQRTQSSFNVFLCFIVIFIFIVASSTRPYFFESDPEAHLQCGSGGHHRIREALWSQGAGATLSWLQLHSLHWAALQTSVFQIHSMALLFLQEIRARLDFFKRCLEATDSFIYQSQKTVEEAGASKCI